MERQLVAMREAETSDRVAMVTSALIQIGIILALVIAIGGAALAFGGPAGVLPDGGVSLTGLGKALAIGFGVAALWAGSLWLSAHHEARWISRTPKPAAHPLRRALRGSTNAPLRVRGSFLVKLVSARFRALLSDYSGRRVEDKVALLRHIACRCRGACLLLLLIAVIAGWTMR